MCVCAQCVHENVCIYCVHVCMSVSLLWACVCVLYVHVCICVCVHVHLCVCTNVTSPHQQRPLSSPWVVHTQKRLPSVLPWLSQPPPQPVPALKGIPGQAEKPCLSHGAPALPLKPVGSGQGTSLWVSVSWSGSPFSLGQLWVQVDCGCNKSMRLLQGVRHIPPGTKVAQVYKVKAAEINVPTPSRG